MIPIEAGLQERPRSRGRPSSLRRYAMAKTYECRHEGDATAMIGANRGSDRSSDARLDDPQEVTQLLSPVFDEAHLKQSHGVETIIEACDSSDAFGTARDARNGQEGELCGE